MQSSTKGLPAGFDNFTINLLKDIETVEGYLAPNEIRFLALMAACPTAKGEILEIGSFKGKSTIILAKSASLAEDIIINAVDPMTAPSETDPDLRGDVSSLEDFKRNIAEHGVADNIRFNQTFSFELAKTWDRPLRLLWIDGDHTYEGTKLDFDGFAPHLADGAIVAIHDVLHEFEGGARVFAESILLSPNFGACGFCGSIAWAQFHTKSRETEKFRAQKLSLYKKLSLLIPFLVFRSELKGFEKIKYKFFRLMIPHGRVDPQKWLDMVL
ncbi:MAG: class I SAM-dependent methyltransferase [Blastocatellia bacterium]